MGEMQKRDVCLRPAVKRLFNDFSVWFFEAFEESCLTQDVFRTVLSGVLGRIVRHNRIFPVAHLAGAKG